MGIPKPYSRMSIDLGAPGKSWKHIPAELVQPGDIVADVGKITDRSFTTEKYVVLTNIDSVGHHFNLGDNVFAFTEVESANEQ